MDSSKPNLLNAFNFLSNEVKDLCLQHEVPVLENKPTPLKFLRDWVSPNKPVLLKGAVSNWPAVQKWNFSYLKNKIGQKDVTVAVTPNGYADAIYKDHFVTPEERILPFSNFLDIMEHPQDNSGVFYIQKQNSNLYEEFPELLSDVPSDISWATQSLGKKPDAVNLWIGDGRAVTSMHKDHYENIYCVISGHKDFILHPPSDLPWIPYRTLPAATFEEISPGEFDIVKSGDLVPWAAVDPLSPDLKNYPNYANATPIKCRVEAGDAFYLPSLWFHHVQQSHGCIAVNYWYDMDFDVKYAYFSFLEQLVKAVS